MESLRVVFFSWRQLSFNFPLLRQGFERKKGKNIAKKVSFYELTRPECMIKEYDEIFYWNTNVSLSLSAIGRSPRESLLHCCDESIRAAETKWRRL